VDFEVLITASLRRMLAAGVFVDPLLVHTYYNARSQSVWEQASVQATTLYAALVNVEAFPRRIGDVPYSPAVLKRCLVETVISTAIWLCHESTGKVQPSADDIRVATDRLGDWLDACTLSTLYTAYLAVVGYDFLAPIIFHKRVRESDFLGGVRHYPYTPDALDTYLLLGLAVGSVRLKATKSGRVVQTTKAGAERFRAFRAALDTSGYSDQRTALSYVYQFETVAEWDTRCAVIWPDGNKVRCDYLSWLGITGREHVLEIACGTGALTFDCGLEKLLRSGGRLTAIDSSTGMLDQAQSKYQLLGEPNHVELVQASVERLPFFNASFDASIGSAFLHFTDEQKALGEMARVVRQGGIVSVLQALRIDFDRPFLREWFQPIYELANRRNVDAPQAYLPSVDDLTTWFRGAGLVNIECELCQTNLVFDDAEAVVQHILHGVSFFQAELIGLPWDDQRAMIMELVDRGHDVVRKYPLSQRIVPMPVVMVKGTSPGGGQ